MQFKDFSKSPKLLLVNGELFIWTNDGLVKRSKTIIPIVVSCLAIEVVTDICFSQICVFHQVLING